VYGHNAGIPCKVAIIQCQDIGHPVKQHGRDKPVSALDNPKPFLLAGRVQTFQNSTMFWAA